MVNMTLSVPKELKIQMDQFPEINWSEVARSAFKEKIKDLEFLNEFKAKSKMTLSDALQLGKKVNKGMRKQYTRNQ